MEKAKETLLKFPCDFPIKVIARKVPDIDEAILAIIKKFAPDAAKASCQIRPSKQNNYWAITITISAQSKTQIDNIYQALHAHPAVVMLL
jgi:uncharacterized protein